MRRVEAAAIDLFGTLVHIDPERYPTVLWEDRPRLSSAPILWEEVRAWHPELQAETFIRASIEVQDELEIERRVEHREILSAERFRRTLFRAGLDPLARGGRLLRDVKELHLRTLVDSARIQARSLFVLAHLARRMPVILVSNFDDGPACRRLLRERGISGFLTDVVVSAEVGRRKPHRSLFDRAAEAAGVSCSAMAMIGDSPTDDIDGARAAGMRTIWIPGSADPPTGWEGPDDRIEALTDLLADGRMGGN